MGSSDSNDANTPSSDGLVNPPVKQSSGKFMDMVRSGSGNKSLRPKSPEKSQTLMRNVVHKPDIARHHQLTSQAHLSNPTSISTVAKTLTTHTAVDADRQARADSINKSQLVSRFNPQAAEVSQTISFNPQAAEVSQTISDTKPAIKPSATLIVARPPVVKQAAVKVQPSQRPKQPSMDIIEKSIARAAEQLPDHVIAAAATHKQARKRTFGKRLSTVMVGGLLVLVVGGFFVYQNFNKIDLYVASSKAGFQATSPGYNPAGYDLSNISSSSGIIQTSYHSNSDGRHYTISEKNSDWDNSTLLDSYVDDVAGQNYETVLSDGRTIYLYGSGNATWVNGGIWYVVTSNNALSDQQLIQLATSM